jgi:hypothetical protein
MQGPPPFKRGGLHPCKFKINKLNFKRSIKVEYIKIKSKRAPENRATHESSCVKVFLRN